MYYWHWVKNAVRRSHTTGFPTEPDIIVAGMGQSGSIPVGEPAAPALFRRAAAVRHLDAGSCNGCESELSLLSSPDYDFSRYGFSFTPSPKHADVLVITGVVTEAMVPVIQEVYEQMGEPKRVVALGSCPLDGWVFRGAPGVRGSLANIVPVTINIPGCPPSPGDILTGLITAVDGRTPPHAEVHP